jgi:hypothetical protein
MALVTTFATTPLTSALYPPWYQKKLEAWKRGEIDWDTGAPLSKTDDSSARDSITFEKLEGAKLQRVLVYLRLDNMPMLLAFMSLLGGQPQRTITKTHPLLEPKETDEQEKSFNPSEKPKRPLRAHGIRLLELTERESSVMKVSEVDEYTVYDPIVNTFCTFGQLHNLAISGEVTVLPQTSFADALVNGASDQASDLIILPWSETGSMSESQTISTDSVKHKLSSSYYISFVQATFEYAPCTTALFVNKDFGGKVRDARPKLKRNISSLSFRSATENTPAAPISDHSHHLFHPFFGGLDDRVALRFVLQLAENPEVTATVVHFETPAGYFDGASTSNNPTGTSTPAFPLSPVATISKTPVDAVLASLGDAAIPSERDSAFFASLKSSLPATLASRVVFESISSSSPITDVLSRATKELGQVKKNAGDLLVLGRNSALRNGFLQEYGGKETFSDNTLAASKCIGLLGERAVNAGLEGSILVLQARGMNS